MLNNIANFVNRVFQPVQPVNIQPAQVSSNPFSNPFVRTNNVANNSIYGKNKPVFGGFYAGYYNGKPNIVGTKLFIEV